MDMSDESSSPAHQLEKQVPSIVKALHRQMREKSAKTRQVNELSEIYLRTYSADPLYYLPAHY